MSTPSEACTTLYKILTEEEHEHIWNPVPVPGDYWLGTELDQKDGFIHSSTSAQLRATLGRYFKDHDKLYLLSIPRSIERVEKTLKFDLAPSVGEYFGHLYEGIDLAQEVTEKKVIRKVNGEWQLGELVF